MKKATSSFIISSLFANGLCKRNLQKILIITLLGLVSMAARADHIIGGEMYYAYLGKVGTNNQYRITLKLFLRCNATTAQTDQDVDITIYNASGGFVKDMMNVPLGDLQNYS